MSNRDVNIKNMTISKTKNSDFLEFLQENEILKNCRILRILDSGNYYIYTFKIDVPEQKEEIKRIQDDWI